MNVEIITMVLLIISEVIPIASKSKYGGLIYTILKILVDKGRLPMCVIYGAEVLAHKDFDGDGVIGYPVVNSEAPEILDV
jgi:hypothetical protein